VGNGLVERANYAPGFGAKTPQRTWSVAKSIAATLVGAAVLSGETSVDDPVGLNYWRRGGDSDPRNAITIDHALRMATGRYSDTPGNRTDPLYFGGSTVDETATAWPVLNPPGTVFRYANNDTLMAVKAIGQWLTYYPPHEFFTKLGMKHTVAETDIRGDYILSSQVWSTAADLANLGQLYLNDGVLPSGERILPEGWAKYVATPSGPQPEGPFGYGAGFWLMNNSDGVPPDTFAAFGNRGQYVVIVPSRQVVIVRRGEDPVGARFDIAAFTRDVLAALEP
jgi:CubicO group peptidase (beta-lactamase class C family)